MNNLLKLALLLIFTSCNRTNRPDLTIRLNRNLTITKSLIKINLSNNFTIFSNLTIGRKDYLSYLYENNIIIYDLKNGEKQDSINVIFSKNQVSQYGAISSFCFNGKDSIFLLLSNAIFFVKNKILAKVIRINEQDTLSYTKIRFANLEDAPIYFDNIRNEIVGQVYCSKCKQVDSSFYQQKLLGGISLTTNKLSLYNVEFPAIYINNYFGFANHVYMHSFLSNTLVSFPCEENVFMLNRDSNLLKYYPVKSIYQTEEAIPLPIIYSGKREEKMKHMVTSPFYTKILYDRYREYYYRFFLKNMPLKSSSGKYNAFEDKDVILMVLNKKFEVIKEFNFGKSVNEYFSFVGNEGLYIKNYISDNNLSNNLSFQLINFVN